MNPILSAIRALFTIPADTDLWPGGAPLSLIDLLDMRRVRPVDIPALGSTLTDPERAALDLHLDGLASPLADTAMLADALSDGDRHDRDEIRAQVRIIGGAMVTGGAA